MATAGRRTTVVQHGNASRPRAVRDGTDTEASLLQPMKAPSPMVATESGILTDDSAVHHENAR